VALPQFITSVTVIASAYAVAAASATCG